MSDQQDVKNNRGLLAVLILLLIAIVELSAILIFRQFNSVSDNPGEAYVIFDDENAMDKTEKASAVAASFRDSVKARLESDSSYDFAEAQKEFESKIANSDSDLKINLAIYYAAFMYDEDGDASRAIDILKSVERYIDEQNRIDYYVALRYYYGEVNDEENVKKYNDIIGELASDIVLENTPKDGDIQNE